MSFGAVLGTTVRYRNAADKRAKQQVRQGERERLARELHDTVAHHVSAIAKQAQAGRAAAATRAEAPLDAQSAIEDAASKTLSEMRGMVQAMRTDEKSDFTPATSIDDIESLAADQSYPFKIEISFSGELKALLPRHYLKDIAHRFHNRQKAR